MENVGLLAILSSLLLWVLWKFDVDVDAEAMVRYFCVNGVENIL